MDYSLDQHSTFDFCVLDRSLAVDPGFQSHRLIFMMCKCVNVDSKTHKTLTYEEGDLPLLVLLPLLVV